MNENEEGSGVVPFTPMGRRADVREVSGTVLFLASDDATFVTRHRDRGRRRLPGAVDARNTGAVSASRARR